MTLLNKSLIFTVSEKYKPNRYPIFLNHNVIYLIVLLVLDFRIRRNERLVFRQNENTLIIDSLFLISIIYFFNENALSSFIYFTF